MKKRLYLLVISFFLSSMTIWFMPLISFEGDNWQKILGFILGSVFWLGFIAGFVFLRQISRKRKADRKYKEHSGIAFFRFFSNTPATVFDISLLISIVTVVIALIISKSPQMLSFGGVFGMVFSLEMHGVFNGRNYRYLNK